MFASRQHQACMEESPCLAVDSDSPSSAPHCQLPTKVIKGNFMPCFPINLAQLSSAKPHIFSAWFLYQCMVLPRMGFQPLRAAPSTFQNNRNQPENSNNKGGRRNRPRDLQLETYPALTKIQEKHQELLGAQAFPLATWDRSELQPEECAGLLASSSPSQPGRGRQGELGKGERGRRGWKTRDGSPDKSRQPLTLCLK